MAFDVDPAMLVRVVRRWVETSRHATVPVRGVTGTLPVLATVAPWPLPPIAGIDAGGIAASLGLSPTLYLGLMRGLLHEYADLAVPRGTAPPPFGRATLAARVHRLAGGAGQLGAVAVRDAAIAVEVALRDPGDEPPPRALQDDLARSLSALRRHARRRSPRTRSLSPRPRRQWTSCR